MRGCSLGLCVVPLGGVLFRPVSRGYEPIKRQNGKGSKMCRSLKSTASPLPTNVSSSLLSFALHRRLSDAFGGSEVVRGYSDYAKSLSGFNTGPKLLSRGLDNAQWSHLKAGLRGSKESLQVTKREGGRRKNFAVGVAPFILFPISGKKTILRFDARLAANQCHTCKRVALEKLLEHSHLSLNSYKCLILEQELPE